MVKSMVEKKTSQDDEDYGYDDYSIYFIAYVRTASDVTKVKNIRIRQMRINYSSNIECE